MTKQQPFRRKRDGSESVFELLLKSIAAEDPLIEKIADKASEIPRL